MSSQDRELPGLIRQLADTLQEELRQHQRLLRVVRRKKEVALGARRGELDGLLRTERELLTNAVTVERDRIALVTELGQLLDHPQPSRLRLAEIILYARPEERDELLDLREDLRDIADELEDLTSVHPLFSRHLRDRLRVYATPSRSKALLGAAAESVDSAVRSCGPTPVEGREHR